MADHVFIIRFDDPQSPNVNDKELRVTNGDQNITFGGSEYMADGSLLSVEDIVEGHSSIPRVQFSILCEEGASQYRLFSADPGPIECLVRYLEYSTSGWQSRWEFIGILSRGQMANYRYRGEIEHIINWKLRTRKKRIWSHSAQKAAYPTDNGLQYAHIITDIRDAIAWKGIDA